MALRNQKEFQDCNLVFLDPDNGIASEGLRLTRRRAGKSVTIEEIDLLTQGRRTMVVYHHHTRRKNGHVSELSDLATRLRKSGLRVSGASGKAVVPSRVFHPQWRQGDSPGI